jgi:hypothetical protein
MSFNWLPRLSPYAQASAWTLRQQSMRQQIENLAFVTDTLTGAGTDEASGVMKLTVKKALARTQAAAQAKVRSVLASVGSDDAAASSAQSKTSTVILKDGTAIKPSPVQYLPGGSKLNIAAGTLTLPNGTVIDTATGARKVNVTV